MPSDYCGDCHAWNLNLTFGILAGLACTYSCSFLILLRVVESMGSSVPIGSPTNRPPIRLLYVLRGCTDAGLAMHPQHTPTCGEAASAAGSA